MSAAAMISGRQSRTQFNQGVRLVESNIQQVITSVATGFYPTDGSFTCSQGIQGGFVQPVFATAAKEQGKNEECIFVGKAIQFAVSGTKETYNTYSVAGLRGAGTNFNTVLSDIKPRLIASGSAAFDASVPDMTQTDTLPYGMEFSRTYYNNNPSKAVAAVGFFSSTGSLGAGDTTQQVNIIKIPGVTMDVSKADGVSQMNASLRTNTASTAAIAAVLNPTNGAYICVNSGGTNQSVLYTIGANGRQGSVESTVKSGKDCP